MDKQITPLTDVNATDKFSDTASTNSAGCDHVGDDAENRDAPEALIRKENRAVKVVRIVLFAVLMLAACITSFFVWYYTNEAEVSSFKESFDNVGSKLVEQLLMDLEPRLIGAQQLAELVTTELSGDNNTELVMIEKWSKDMRRVMHSGKVDFGAWGPVLKNEEERLAFEQTARNTEVRTGKYKQCFVCGEELKGFLEQEIIVNVTVQGGQILPTCGDVEAAGRQGRIDDGRHCKVLTETLPQTCGCVDLAPGTELVSPIVQKEDKVFRLDTEYGVVMEPGGLAPCHPFWQTSSGTIKRPMMFNQNSEDVRAESIASMMQTGLPSMSQMYVRQGPLYNDYLGSSGNVGTTLHVPIFDSLPQRQSIIATMTLDIEWDRFVIGILPDKSEFLNVVVEDSCGRAHTFAVSEDRKGLRYVGQGAILPSTDHQPLATATSFEKFEAMMWPAAPPDQNRTGANYCNRFRFHAYSTAEYQALYSTNNPYVYSAFILGVFLLTSVIFMVYDWIIRRRQAKVMESANRTNNIVTDLFPEVIRQRLYNDSQLPSKVKMQNLMADPKSAHMGQEPIADLFPHVTVMFLDIVSFTSWASERDPSQVFRLLETLYQSFDELAKLMGVFKVETIGDSYVCAVGIPNARKDHATIMAKFAKRCLKRMSQLTKSLEIELGPCTGGLKARVGLHSGPVTAGVLRGEKARFQLFGDTVNMASRMESTGEPSRIHCSKSTVKLLVKAGKEDWVTPRQEPVMVKGKGNLETYFVLPNDKSTQSARSDETESAGFDESTPLERLVDWNTEVLHSRLAQLGSSRLDNTQSDRQYPESFENAGTTMAIEEISHILDISSVSGTKRRGPVDASSMPPKVKAQLHGFVTAIASTYGEVPFHNFEHASHVIMSTEKLMKRIVTPDDIDYEQDEVDVIKQIHNSTYGISSDVLLQFASVFAALIHDAGHTGLTNAELVKMGAPVAAVYRNQSVAEQNSVDIAWTLLMEPKFDDLRHFICPTEMDMERFRQLVVNAVMATDIADKNLKEAREKRWNEAFSNTNRNDQVAMNRKATIIFDYIIQASDIAHTMQHWLVYQKFNKRLFEERYIAWVNGHMGANDPSVGWYKGELWFFDNYIIPMAEKLRKCGVFGVSYNETLEYAVQNRAEWEEKGKDIVAGMLQECQAKYLSIIVKGGDGIAGPTADKRVDRWIDGSNGKEEESERTEYSA